ncbi:MAG: DUF4954 family protein [Muribaculaceae bacterium]|nr:DUF4954 family protein [Muribaculaceae bacterium]
MATKHNYRELKWWEIRRLEDNGCVSDDWSRVHISDGTDLSRIRNVRFAGDIRIGNDVTIENVGLLEMEPEAVCGIGTEVCVFDETGSRSVRIYPGLSAQMAMLIARDPNWAHNHAKEMLDDHIHGFEPSRAIGDRAVIRNCGRIINVSIDHEVHIEGASYLKNGSIINNAASGKALSRIGEGVNAENFIIEDGSADSAAIIRNCYIGQGAMLEKGFTAHDSLFFANCSLENGEACAVFAGPYTVSMHKSTLLIGCQTSFMNAGSGTNQSNHMYKLGPVHWGILERGVKTSSFSYLMLGAKIGAFSLLMGQHKTHPDSSEFPFSYLFGDEKGATVVVPGAMLRSCGLLRDEKKWPARDRRQKRKLPLHDRIIFDVLNPLTVDTMLNALDIIASLLARPADDDRFLRYKGMKFSRAALERAAYLYRLAIYKYLHTHTAELGFPPREPGSEAAVWIDVAGLLMPKHLLVKAMEMKSVNKVEEVFENSSRHYANLQRAWISSRFSDEWRRNPEVIADYAAEFDRMIEDDRRKYLDDLADQNAMLRLF